MIPTLLAVSAGIFIGIGFFAGLWWTVRTAPSSKQPGILFAVSFALRTALALGAFYLVGGGNWSRIAACLAGFIMGRMLVKRASNANSTLQSQPLKGGAR